MLWIVCYSSLYLIISLVVIFRVIYFVMDLEQKKIFSQVEMLEVESALQR